MSKSIFGIIIALFVALQVRAEQPTFNITNTDAAPGDIIDIDFHVDNFTNIIVVQYSVNWNPAVLKFRTIKNFNASVPGLSPSVFGTPQVFLDAGKFTLAWIESSITPITIPDGSLFFTVEFEVVGTPCQSSAIAITDDPTEIVVSEDGDTNIGLIANNGNVNIPGSGCAADINLIGNTVIGACGGTACIQFTVENFTTVGAIEFSLVYNPTVLQFKEFQNFAPLPGFGAGNTNLFAPGVLRVLWFDSNVQNDTLPDGTILFEICFDIIGNGGQSTDITFGTVPPPMISDIDGHPHTVTITPANITAQCQLEGFALIADTVCTMPNGLACFDIKVNDFDELIAAQLSMNWDSAVFEYDHLEAFGIPGLNIDGFGVPGNPGVKEGQLVMSWLDLSLEGVTLPDNATIFRLCLKAKGAAGTSSSVTFSSNPLDLEFLGLPDTTLVPTLVQGRGDIKISCDGCSLSYTIDHLNPTCPREMNGVINLTVIENCPETPTYQWSNPPGGTTQDLTGIGAGTYTVTITLGTQVIIATETLVDPPAIAVTGSITNPSPISACNGAVDITVTGGTPPYTYNWNTTPPSTTQDISNLCAGSYTVTVMDNMGCSFIPDPYIVGAEMAAGITNVSCHGGSNGAINLSVSFGTPPYTFVWNTTPVQTTEDLNNLKAGVYCVTATDNGGSTRDSCFTITEPTAIILTASITNDLNENCQGAIDLNVTGGVLPYSYHWSNNAISQDITQLCPAQYCVTVTDGNGCTADTCFTVFAGGISVSLAATQYGNFQTSCDGTCNGQITATVVGGTPPITYHWSNGATTPAISGLCAGTYTLTVTDQSAQTASATTVLNAPPPFTFSYITTNPSDYISENGAIAVVVNGGTPPYTYQWTGPATGNTASLNNVPAGTYTIHITDANGCQAQDSEQLVPDIDIPCYSAIKVITPNSDGKNDYFIISCIFDFDNHLYIYNRYGGLVYQTTNYQNNWDGVDQDNAAVPDGGYHWVLEVFHPGGNTELLRGTVTLLRTAD